MSHRPQVDAVILLEAMPADLVTLGVMPPAERRDLVISPTGTTAHDVVRLGHA